MKPSNRIRPMPVLAVICGIAVTLAVVNRFWAGQTLQYSISPDGRSIAECREYKQSSATSTDLKTVELRTRFNPVRHTVLSGLDYGATLSITWIDSRNLLVTCRGCNPLDLQIRCNNCTALDIVKRETEWRDVSIKYEWHD